MTLCDFFWTFCALTTCSYCTDIKDACRHKIWVSFLWNLKCQSVSVKMDLIIRCKKDLSGAYVCTCNYLENLESVWVLPKNIKSTLKCLEVSGCDDFSLCLPLGHAGPQHQGALLRDLRVVNHALPQPLLFPVGIVPIYFLPITQTCRSQTGQSTALYARSKREENLSRAALYVRPSERKKCQTFV